MKKNAKGLIIGLVLGIIIGCIIGGAAGLYFYFHYQKSLVENIKTEQKNLTYFPEGLLDRYDITYAQSTELPENKNEILIVGFVAKNSDVAPGSYLAIYEREKSGGLNLGRLMEVFKYSPVVPKEVDYPNPLALEKVWLVSAGVILTSWGETGANYFGTHPIVISYKYGKFQSTPFYEGNLAERSEIKKSSWTQKDFEAKNYFDEKDMVKTIQTQGIDLVGNDVELSFYSDSNCHACKHTFAVLKFPLGK